MKIVGVRQEGREVEAAPTVPSMVKAGASLISYARDCVVVTEVMMCGG